LPIWKVTRPLVMSMESGMLSSWAARAPEANQSASADLLQATKAPLKAGSISGRRQCLITTATGRGDVTAVALLYFAAVPAALLFEFRF
jgi:hypothetical protein